MAMQEQHLHLSTTATLITPECKAAGCHLTGDQYTMVR
jgi:hypothetical protein